jgi:hypothetical protein
MPRTLIPYQQPPNRPGRDPARHIERSTERRATDNVVVGVIHTTDAVRRIIAARSREELSRLVVSYVRAVARERLWPSDADGVEQAIARGDVEVGIRAYFECVGKRWDPEWLVVDDLALTDDD